MSDGLPVVSKSVLPGPTNDVERVLHDLISVRLGRLALQRPGEMVKARQSFADRGVLKSSIAAEGYLGLDCGYIKNLAFDGTKVCIDTLMSLRGITASSWTYAIGLMQAAVQQQAEIARSAFREYSLDCGYHAVDSQNTSSVLEAVIAQAFSEVKAELQTRRLIATGTDDRRFMELAVNLARKCQSEPGRENPKVGAVLVKDGTILAEGHRGETEPGEHAEFVVLERKLKDEIVAGSTLYTTLEPCTTRNPPKVPCAERIRDRKIRRVVIGMLDPDSRIRGNGQLTLRASGIEIDVFDPDLMSAVEDLNRGFSRSRSSGTPPPASQKVAVELKAIWVSHPVHGKAGYDLYLSNLTQGTIDDARVTLHPPSGFGINKGGSGGGWHQDPSMEHPRIWIDEPAHKGDPAYVGRLRLLELPRRLQARTASLLWKVTGRNIEPVEGEVPIDLEPLIPPEARAALSSIRGITFQSVTSLSEIAFKTDVAGVAPSLNRDGEAGTVLRSVQPHGDAALILPFDPPVPLTDTCRVVLRLKVPSTAHFMLHIGLQSADSRELYVTYKPEDGVSRKHWDNERIVPLGSKFFTGAWQTLTLDLQDEITKLSSTPGVVPTAIQAIRIRGDYVLHSIELPSAPYSPTR